jgi:hypothetical protein
MSAPSSDSRKFVVADDEHHLVLAKAVHLREQLVDHRVLDARAHVGAALVRERVDLVEDDHRRRSLPRLTKDPPEILFGFSDPLRSSARAPTPRSRSR